MTIKARPVQPIQSRSDSELRSEFEKFSRSEFVFLGGLVAALVTESILGWSFTDHRDSWFNIALLGLGIVVALCCAGEYWSAHRSDAIRSELDRRSEEKVAEAMERAANAELETARLKKALSWREIPKGQGEAIIKALRPQPHTILVLSTYDAEATAHSSDIIGLLRISGWDVKQDAMVWGGSWFGIFVSDNDGSELLAETFSAAGIEVVRKGTTPMCSHASELRLFVGMRGTPSL